MTLTRQKTIWFVCVLCLCVLSLRPEPFVERVLGVFFAPTRVLAALASPLSVFDDEVQAAAPQVEALERRCRTVRDRYREIARPPATLLARGAVAIEAEVEGRAERSRDTLWIRLATAEGVRPGVPVVCGEAYVGRVLALDPERPRRARVELLTGADFRVGAAVESGNRRSDMVCGGLAPRASGADRSLRLAVHHPSDRAISEGEVRVAEPPALVLDDEDARLGDGFLLGDLFPLQAREGEEQRLALRPALDFAAGLFHVCVLVPPERAPSRVPPIEDLFEEDAWLAGDLILQGELSAWRSGRKLSLGSGRGARAGGAILRDARFLGRVERAGATLSDVRLLSDPGFSFPALAAIDGEPCVLGRLVSLGFDEARGRVRFRMQRDAPLSESLPAVLGRASVSATLFTGAGERGVPLGLFVGDTTLATRAGTQVIEVELETPGAGEVFVRRPTAEVAP